MSYGLHLINKLIFQSTNRCGVAMRKTKKKLKPTAWRAWRVKWAVPKIWALTFRRIQKDVLWLV